MTAFPFGGGLTASHAASAPAESSFFGLRTHVGGVLADAGDGDEIGSLRPVRKTNGDHRLHLGAFLAQRSQLHYPRETSS